MSTEDKINMLNDNPIKKEIQDSLNFNEFSKTIKEVILSSDTPLTIGLYGKWGSGKTSLMKLIQNLLEDNDLKITVKTVWFDAWKFDKSHDLRVALIQSILRKMAGDRKADISVRDRARDLLERVNWLGLGLNIINLFSPKSINFQEATDPLLKESKDVSYKNLELLSDFEENFTSIVKDYVSNKKKNYDKIYNKINESNNKLTIIDKISDFFRKYSNKNNKIDNKIKGPIRSKKINKDDNGKLVVFVDDLDRCIPEKAISILEAIKLFLNAEHTIFIIGADKEVIENGIKAKYDANSEWGIKYLDKIIQIPFFLPPLREDIITDEFITKLPIPDEIKKYKDTFVEVGSNPRTIKRLINQFQLQKSLAENQERYDVKPAILAILGVIQFTHPEFYNTLFRVYVENKINLIRKLVEYNNSNESERKELEWKSLEKYLNEEKFMKFLGKEPSLYDSEFDLEPYIYLTKRTASLKTDKVDHISVGNAYSEEGNYEKAIASFNKALNLDQNSIFAWYNNGTALAKLGDYDEALECFNKVIKLNPNLANAWNNKGIILDHLKIYDEALECFNKAIELDLKYADAWNNKGITFSNLENYDDALECFNKAIELDPEYADAWNNKGMALANLGNNPEEAVKCIAKAVDLDPEYADDENNKELISRKWKDMKRL